MYLKKKNFLRFKKIENLAIILKELKNKENKLFIILEIIFFLKGNLVRYNLIERIPIKS